MPVKGGTLQAMLSYMYGSLPTIDPSMAVELFTISDQYALHGLRKECVLRMTDCLQVRSVRDFKVRKYGVV